jgi:glycosyl transferase, family 25
MALFEFVIISLPSSAERRAMLSERLRAFNWPWRYFDAHTAKESTLPYDPERALLRRGYRLKPGEIGCFSSHYECLCQHADPNRASPEFMFVLEDDVFMDESFDFEALASLMLELRIDYLKLYARFMTRSRYIGRIGQRALYRFVVPPYGTQAYVVSKVGAMRLAGSISRIDRPIDDELDRYWNNGLPTYALFPYPVLELNLSSTILDGSSHATDKSRLQRLISMAFTWVDKIPREWTNLRLLRRDSALRAKLLGRVRSV